MPEILSAPDAPPNSPSTPPTQSAEPTRGPTRAVLGALVAPGAPSFFRRPVVSWFLLLFGVLLPVALLVVGFVRRNEITGLVLDETVLRVIQIALAVFVLTRLIAVAEVINAHDSGSRKRLASFVAVIGMLVIAFPAGFSVVRADQLSDVINDVFVTSGSKDPLAIAGDVANSDEYQNVLLLGGDEGPARVAELPAP